MAKKGEISLLKVRFATEIILVLIIIFISLFSITNLNTDREYVKNFNLFNIVISIALLFLLFVDEKRYKGKKK